MKKMFVSILFVASSLVLAAQPGGVGSGANALTSLTSDLQDYIDPVTTVVYIVAAVVGVVGALRVYINWQAGKDNVMQNATGWFGSALFLLIANTVLRAMFVV